MRIWAISSDIVNNNNTERKKIKNTKISITRIHTYRFAKETSHAAERSRGVTHILNGVAPCHISRVRL